MKAFRAYLQGAPLGVLFAWFTGFYFLGTYGFALLDGTSKLNLVSALIRVVGAGIFGGIMTALVARQRRRDGGRRTSVQITTALKTGAVPEDAEPSIWLPALEARRKQNERAHWVNPIVFGLFTLLGIWLITQDPTGFIPWIVTAFFIAVAILSLVQARRAVTKIEALIVQMHGRPGD
ncbi:hypothetical protein GCM10025867_18320 [Frondihabitans sucicola]|uniref:Uncharacterized protein n=1 Tax=Frondihabitans sucicola TaxID=1268041 RepID=A0ABN6Y0R5_9MICO|nr:hypothetical protein [Frondihabitans sucicola]BDZ49591.1 hypothetical protein GCM10025867_18320 [Frondihabitans sucicola]